MNFIIIWIALFTLVAISFLTKIVLLWVPIILYIVTVIIRAKETIGNYRNTEKQSARDEKLQLDQKAEEMAERGLISSGFRNREEKKIRDDFEFERRKKKRKLQTDLVNILFLK